MQFLDYNLRRLEKPVQDRKGLEFLTILSLVSFLAPSLFPPVTLAPATTSPPSPTSIETVPQAKDKGKGKEMVPPLERLPALPPVIPSLEEICRATTD